MKQQPDCLDCTPVPGPIIVGHITELGERVPPIPGDPPCAEYDPASPGAGVENDGRPQCAACGWALTDHHPLNRTFEHPERPILFPLIIGHLPSMAFRPLMSQAVDFSLTWGVLPLLLWWNQDLNWWVWDGETLPCQVRPMVTLYRRLVAAGVTLDEISAVLPDWWEDSMADAPSSFALAQGYLIRGLQLDPSSVLDPQAVIVRLPWDEERAKVIREVDHA